jgi:alpha-tubulin suppressor-like RCC1 family protein
MAGAGVACLILLAVFLVRSRSKAAPPSVTIAPLGSQVVTPKMVGNWGRIVILASDGTLWGWGDSKSGELGVRANQACGPRPFSRERSWRDVATGSGFTLGLKSDGTLWAWGADKYAAKSTDPAKPIRVGSDTNWMHVAAGASYYLLQKTDGTLWTWGANNEGQLGDGTVTDSKDPIQIGSGPWAEFASGAFHAAAVAPGGTLWDWGRHSAGSGTALAQVGNDTDWVSVSSGEYHTLARKSDGSWWIWGDNAAFIQPAAATTPARISGTETWDVAAGGNSHTVAIGGDGSLWALGRNFQGEVGDGTRTERRTPVRIGAATNWIAVAATANTSAAMSGDGSVFIWGIRSDIPAQTRYDSNFWRVLRGLYQRLTRRGFMSTVTVYSDSPTPVKLMQFQPAVAPDQLNSGSGTNHAVAQPSSEH